MKRRLLISIILGITILFTGCGNSIVKKSIEQAKTLIESKEYDKAILSLEMALDEDKENEEANKLYEIVDAYQKSKKYIDENNIEEAKKILDLINEEYMNYSIKDDIDNLKSEVDNHYKEIEKISIYLTEAESLFNYNKYGECKVYLATNMLGSQGDNIEPNKYATEEQKKKALEIVDKCEEAIEEEEAKRLADEARIAEEAANQSMTIEMAIEKIKALNDLSHVRNLKLSFIPNEYKPWDLDGYGFQVGINGDLKFETIGYYFVSSLGKTFKQISTGEYEPVN